MRHFFVPEAGDGPYITIGGADANHIRRVLRMKPGEKLVVSNGSDRDFYCVLREFTEDGVIVEVLPEAVEEAELSAELILYQGLPKADKLEWIIQKAVELGAARVTPVAMKRSVVRLDEKKQRAKLPRWQAIAESAAKQSGRRIIPEVTPVLDMEALVREAADLDLLLVPYENARGMRGTAEALRLLAPGMRAGIVIGPEGGFEPEEIDRLSAAGARIISLGRRILRTETAGLAALTLCMAALEEIEEENREREGSE